jgi:hypothetical protein
MYAECLSNHNNSLVFLLTCCSFLLVLFANFKIQYYFSIGMSAVMAKNMKISVVAELDPGSSAFLTPGSRIRGKFLPDPGSQITDPQPMFLRAK